MKPVKETVVALGKVADALPSIEGPHTVVVKAFVEVPMSGAYEMHAGFGESTHAMVTVDGKEAYRKDPGGEAVIQKITLEKGQALPGHDHLPQEWFGGVLDGVGGYQRQGRSGMGGQGTRLVSVPHGRQGRVDDAQRCDLERCVFRQRAAARRSPPRPMAGASGRNSASAM